MLMRVGTSPPTRSGRGLEPLWGPSKVGRAWNKNILKSYKALRSAFMLQGPFMLQGNLFRLGCQNDRLPDRGRRFASSMADFPT